MDDFELGGKLPPQRQLPTPSSKPIPRPAVSLGLPAPAPGTVSTQTQLPSPPGTVSTQTPLPPAVSDSSAGALEELVDSITELVEISAETRDITLESYKEATTEVAGESKEAQDKTALSEESEYIQDSSSWRDTYNQIADKVNEGLSTLGDGIVEAGEIAHNPFVLVDKLFEEGLPKLKPLQDKESNDTFDPNRVLREMAGVRQRDEGLADVLESKDLVESVVSDSPLTDSLDNLADVMAVSPLTDSLDNLAEVMADSPLASLAGDREVMADSPLASLAGDRGSGLLGITVESSRPFTSQAVDPMVGSPDSLSGGGGGAVAVLRQMSASLRTLTMAGTKARPIYTYLLDLDNVAGEEGLYESLSGGGGGGFFGSSVVDIDKAGDFGGRGGGGGSSLGLGDAKWIAISGAIIALAGPIDKLVTAMTDPNTGFGKVVDAIGGFVQSLLAEDGPMMKLINTLTDVAVDILKPLGSTISGLIQVIGPPLTTIAKMLSEAVVKSLAETLEMFSLLKNNPSQFFSIIADGMKALFSAIFVDLIGEIISSLRMVLPEMFGGLDEKDKAKVALLSEYGLSNSDAIAAVEDGEDIRIEDEQLLRKLGLEGAKFGMLEVSYGADGKPRFHAVSGGTYDAYGDIIARNSDVSSMPGVRDVTSLMRDHAFGLSAPPLPPEPKAAADGYRATAPGSGGSYGSPADTGSTTHIENAYFTNMSRNVSEDPHGRG